MLLQQHAASPRHSRTAAGAIDGRCAAARARLGEILRCPIGRAVAQPHDHVGLQRPFFLEPAGRTRVLSAWIQAPRVALAPDASPAFSRSVGWWAAGGAPFDSEIQTGENPRARRLGSPRTDWHLD